MSPASSVSSRPCSEPAERAWVQLIRAHRAAMSSVERALRSAGMPPLEWYDVLLELERGGRLRARDLQDKLLLAQYNLSRLVDRMEKQGLIRREPCPDDGRSQWLSITDSGAALRRRMWPVYGAAIEAAVGARLTPPEADRLAALLKALAQTAE